MHAAIGDEVVPLAPATLAAFKALRELAGESPWVMRSPHQGKTKSGHLGETAIARVVRELFKAGKLKMPAWTPHDLRRTARTYWAEKLGLPWDLCERLLGHQLPKIARTYDTGSYLEQRRGALEKWDAYLQHLERPAAPVAFLRG
jgi:integrase